MASTRNNNRPAELEARVAACLARHVRRGQHLVIALSGGVDSVTLLHLLHRCAADQGFRLSALHVHHGLSPQADAWQRFCEALCQSLGIALEVARVEVRIEYGEGLEAAARRARHAVFARQQADWVVLAHQRDDQVETLLFNLLRGSGWAGAAAMPVVRPVRGRHDLRLLRPLLELSRAEIEDYARRQGLAWIEDESNRDLRHARNFLRHEILPRLRQRFPACDAMLARAAAHFAEGQALLEELAVADAQPLLHEGRIVVAGLCRLEQARACNLLRHVLRSNGLGVPETARLREALRQTCQAAADRRVSVDLGPCRLQRHRGELWLTPKPAAVPAARTWRGEEELAWGGARLRFVRVTGAGIALRRLAQAPVSIRTRRGGERLRPDARRPRRSLKKLFQEYGVPPWQRERLPLLWCGEELVWVAGIGTDCAWQCPPDEPGLQPVLLPEEDG